jgi:glycerol-3-phosphate acyltransferase PlsX
MVVEGSALALRRMPDVRFLFYGDETHVAREMALYPALGPVASIRHTTVAVKSDDRPSQALRHSRDSSMGLAIQAVKDGAADVAVSAGNTGALMAMSKFMLKTMPGIERPALIGLLPTRRGTSAMLDLGANVECDEDNLVQFAIMGAAYAGAILGLPRPTVGLLNVGVEELKGNESVRLASDKLRHMDLPFEFVGFVEGDGIGLGAVDVFVCDGFSGNVALKASEGIARFIAGLMGEAFHSNLLTKLGYLFAAKGMKALQRRLDPNRYNGGVFLGLNGLVVKSHGSANAAGFASAIGVAVDMVRDGILHHIANDLERLGAATGTSRQAAAS